MNYLTLVPENYHNTFVKKKDRVKHRYNWYWHNILTKHNPKQIYLHKVGPDLNRYLFIYMSNETQRHSHYWMNGATFIKSPKYESCILE